MDSNYNLKLNLFRNDQEITHVPVAVWRQVLNLLGSNNEQKFLTMRRNIFLRLSDLTESDALDLACGVPEIQNGVLREEFVTEYSKTKGKWGSFFICFDVFLRIFRSSFTYFLIFTLTDYEATLIFKVKESEEETRRRRDERQKEKERKKLEREKRIANYGSSKKTKLSKS